MPLDATAVLDALDPDQRRAATSPAMPLAVVAPAGSGKTRVLAARIAHRVASGEIEPSHILCVTFTRKAADELRQRLRGIGLTDHVEAGTFHAIALRCLRDRWASLGRSEPVLLDQIGPFLADHVVPGATRAEIRDLVAEIGWARARGVGPDSYEDAARAAGRPHRRAKDWVAATYAAFMQAKSRHNRVDFDDLLAACATAIDGDPAFAAAQRWRFRHLFVDEFQDVNPLQFRLLEAWRGNRWDVFVVGDAHQSIYGWNGAEPGLLTGLRDRWPALETIHLDRTHRSTPQIVDAAAAVVRAAGLPDRAPRSTGSAGPPARVHAHPDEAAEVSTTATLIRRRRGPGEPWSSFGVLARTHDQVMAIARGFEAAQIPCQLQRQSGLLREAAVRALLRRLERDDRPLLTALGTTIEDAPDDGPIARVLAIADRQVEGDPELSGAEFAQWAFAHLSDEGRSLDAVTVSTIHAAKGLEWPIVHILGCEDGSIPHAAARRKDARDEEARLLYVAVTRAETELHLHWAARREVRGTVRERVRSPFLDGFEDATIDEPAEAPTRLPDQLRQVRAKVSPPPVADDLTGSLRAWRERRARAARTDPEVVLNDEMLSAIVRERPATVNDLRAVSGLGTSRARRYGEELVSLVRASEGQASGAPAPDRETIEGG